MSDILLWDLVFLWFESIIRFSHRYFQTHYFVILSMIYFSDCTQIDQIVGAVLRASTRENWFQLFLFYSGHMDFVSAKKVCSFFSFYLQPDERNKSHSTTNSTKNKSSKHQFNVSIFTHCFQLSMWNTSCSFSFFFNPFALLFSVFVFAWCLMLPPLFRRMLRPIAFWLWEWKQKVLILCCIFASGTFFLSSVIHFKWCIYFCRCRNECTSNNAVDNVFLRQNTSKQLSRFHRTRLV